MQGRWQPFEFKTQRLTLRPYEISDIDGVFEYACDPEFSRFIPVPVPYARSDAEALHSRSRPPTGRARPRSPSPMEGAPLAALT